MKKIVLSIAIIFSLATPYFCYANDSSDLKEIRSVIQKASIEFESAKKENDLKKLTQIAKQLYDNHQRIKKRLNGAEPISLLCNGKDCKDLPLQLGDKISLVFNLSFTATKDYEKSKLIWQVQSGKKIIKKGDKDIYEKGGFKKFAKEIIIDKSFKDGKYRIAMHHKSDTGTTRGEAFFTVKRPIQVKEIVVSTNKAAKASDDTIYPDEDIYILSGFLLDNPKGKISIDVKLVDNTKQETLIETSFIRPKKDDTTKNQPLRFRIPASKLYKNQKLAFKMKFYSDDINPIVRKVSIPVQSFKLIVSAPATLQAGRSGKYTVAIPKKFVKPLKVNIAPRGGILLSHKTQLSGTINAINKSNESGSFYIRVTDAKGRTVSTRQHIQLTVKEEAIVDSSNGNQFSVKDRYGNKYVVNTNGIGKTNTETDYPSWFDNYEPNDFSSFDTDVIKKYFNTHVISEIKHYDDNGRLEHYFKYSNGELVKAYEYITGIDGHRGKVKIEVTINSNTLTIVSYDVRNKTRYFKDMQRKVNRSGSYRDTVYKANGAIKHVCDYDTRGNDTCVDY